MTKKMNKSIKYRAVSKLAHEGQHSIVYFTLEEVMRGKVLFAYPEHWDFHQFAGTDHDGKDVYEGDIVDVYNANEYQHSEEDDTEHEKLVTKQLNEDDAFYGSQEVKASPESSGYFSEHDNGEYCPPLFSEDDVLIFLTGNIFTSPELLAQRKLIP